MTKTIKELRSLYARFTRFVEKQEKADITGFTNVEVKKLTTKELDTIVSNYRKRSFFSFLRVVKHLAYAEKVFDVLPKVHDLYEILLFVEFLVAEKVIMVAKDGKITFLKKNWLAVLPRPQTEREIEATISKKLGKRMIKDAPVTDLFKEGGFSLTTDFDQAPISQRSAIFVIHKILESLPLSKEFLFVGDDDFMSVMLCLADPSLEAVVIDADETLLSAIKKMAKTHDLKISPRLIDVRKPERVKGTFTGFLCNPPYTEKGAETFVRYGMKHLGPDGGFVFLEHGDDGVGNRYLFLQKFFSSKNMMIEEVFRDRILYPHLGVYEDYELTNKRLAKFIDPKVIVAHPELAASLYIFNYVPFPVKRVPTKQSIYSYL